MNYQRIYENLTSKDMIDEYTEKHHIIPKCIGGSNDLTNIVKLTPEAHYVAHQLLVKIYPNNKKLIYAANMMCISNKNHSRNNKRYGWLRRKLKQALSAAMKGKSKPISIETRAKISAAMKGKLKSAEHRANLSAARQLRGISNETRAKISKTSKGRIPHNKGVSTSAETRAKLSAAMKGKNNPNYGKSLSAEHKAKLSAAMKGKSLSAETRAKLSAAMKGKNNPNYGKSMPKSAEHRAKLSAAMKGKSLSAEHKAKLSAAMKGKPKSAEAKAKMCKPKEECIHCNKLISVSNIASHTAKCKSK